MVIMDSGFAQHQQDRLQDEVMRMLDISERDLTGTFVTVREDTGDILGVVGERYDLLQNMEAIQIVETRVMPVLMDYADAWAGWECTHNTIVDILCDLMHLCYLEGEDFHGAYRSAMKSFLAEIDEDGRST